MINQERMKEQAQISGAVYMSAVELVSNVVRELSGRDLSGNTPNGDLRDNFGREITAAKISAEIEGRLGGNK
jgi:hypothetical protein